MIKIFHTSDNHIGITYNKYDPERQKKLLSARFESLKRMVSLANEKNTDLFVVAGDLFNSLSVSTKMVDETIDILKGFEGKAVLVLPGNHDYFTGSEVLWKHFLNHCGDLIVLLYKHEVKDLSHIGLPVKIYPAACRDKHSKENKLGWIKNEIIDPNTINIGIAHGAIIGLSPDLAGEYYSMGMDEMSDIGLDLWLLGHTHVPYPLKDETHGERIFNAGIHEPDAINYRHEGSAFYIEIDPDKRVHAKRIPTGYYRFYELREQLSSQNTLEEVIQRLIETYSERSVIRLTLMGRISKEENQIKQTLYDQLHEAVFYADIRDDDCLLEISSKIISEEFVEGSFPFKLLQKLIDQPRALQMAYDMIDEERKRNAN